MQPLQNLTWTLPESLELSDLQVALDEHFDLKPEPAKQFSRSWYDTFDWRIFRKKRLLMREGSRWSLQGFQGKQLHILTTRRKRLSYSWQFPDSPLKTALQDLLDVRALIELGVENIQTNTIRILNRDKKIVVYLQLQESTNPKNGQRLVTISLQEVRGYPKRFQQAAAFLNKFGLKALDGPADTLRCIVQGQGRQPLDYSSGYNVPLDPHMSSIEAVGHIYRSLIANIQRNEHGVIDDIDSEFLHDLRVAVRRTRSALALTKGVLASDLSDHFKQEFRYIGQITGPVRDLDVYLLSEADYKVRLPDRLQEGLLYFFEDLAARRKQEQQKLVRAMHGPRYKQILADWEKALESEGKSVAGKDGEVPIGTLAGKIIHKRFRRVLNDGKRINEDTPDSELHCLRIECKKLRYSLEFFASLYNAKHMKKLIGQLKKLQDNLGDFNDLSVQQEMLAEYLSQIRPGSKKSRELAASIGGLMTGLALQHQEVRSHFEETFAFFAAKENLNLFHKLFDS